MSVNGIDSGEAAITCGVPQGPVLGPLLFLLSINDMPNVVPGEKLRILADDTNLFTTCKAVADLNTFANTQVNKLSCWSTVDKLHLTIEKTCYSIFSASKSVFNRRKNRR